MKETSSLFFNCCMLVTATALLGTIAVYIYSSHHYGNLRDYLKCKEAPEVCDQIYPSAAATVKDARLQAQRQ